MNIQRLPKMISIWYWHTHTHKPVAVLLEYDNYSRGTRVCLCAHRVDRFSNAATQQKNRLRCLLCRHKERLIDSMYSTVQYAETTPPSWWDQMVGKSSFHANHIHFTWMCLLFVLFVIVFCCSCLFCELCVIVHMQYFSRVHKSIYKQYYGMEFCIFIVTYILANSFQ